MKILVTCGGGVSTNILVSNMKYYANKSDVIKAVPLNNALQFIPEFDVVLVAPQIRYSYDFIAAKCQQEDVECALLDMQTYGCMDGETIINLARDLIERKNKKGVKAEMKKLKITLACAGGISTSILVARIIAAIKERGIEEIECNAYATTALDNVVAGSDVILLGPQVCYMEDDIVKKYPDIPVRLMDMRDYGMMNAEKIVKELFEEFGW